MVLYVDPGWRFQWAVFFLASTPGRSGKSGHLCANDGIIYVYILTGTNMMSSLLRKCPEIPNQARSHDQVQPWGCIRRFLAKP